MYAVLEQSACTVLVVVQSVAVGRGESGSVEYWQWISLRAGVDSGLGPVYGLGKGYQSGSRRRAGISLIRKPTLLAALLTSTRLRSW